MPPIFPGSVTCDTWTTNGFCRGKGKNILNILMASILPLPRQRWCAIHPLPGVCVRRALMPETVTVSGRTSFHGPWIFLFLLTESCRLHIACQPAAVDVIHHGFHLLLCLQRLQSQSVSHEAVLGPVLPWILLANGLHCRQN